MKLSNWFKILFSDKAKVAELLRNELQITIDPIDDIEQWNEVQYRQAVHDATVIVESPVFKTIIHNLIAEQTQATMATANGEYQNMCGKMCIYATQRIKSQF